MAEEVLVKEMLTNEMIKDGAELISRLDQAHLDVSACLWLYISESNVWRLIIASPEVSEHGPKKIYQKIQSTLSKIPQKKSRISLREISLMENNHQLISLLRITIRTGDGISGIRLSKSTINGHFIEDAYIYRIQ